MQDNIRAFRASVLHFLGDPSAGASADTVEFFPDGLLVVENGRVRQLGDAAVLLPSLSADVEIVDYTGRLIMPGFIDTHIHYPQTDMIASYGAQLLEWLEKYTFPTERRFADPEHAREVAEFFIEELLRNGTSTALVLGTIHETSVDALFSAAQSKRMRMLAGKVMMDRNCPDYLQDSPESSYSESRKLIERWHNQDRMLYAVTPRFAPTSTEAQLEQAGKLVNEFPDVYLHTHVAENRKEVAWVAELFPWSRSYLDVYDRYGLVRERSVFAHCIHLDEEDRRRMSASGAAMSFCPTSNLFLGSGLFDVEKAREHSVRVGIGTDVGAGTSFNMFQTLNESYKVTQMAGHSLSAYGAFYLATLGGAKSLYIDDRVGNFEAGKEADFVVINFASTPLVKRRMEHAQDIQEKLFVLMMLGDDRSISATYILGQAAYSQTETD